MRESTGLKSVRDYPTRALFSCQGPLAATKNAAAFMNATAQKKTVAYIIQSITQAMSKTLNMY